MNEFTGAALPWIALGVILALFCAGYFSKKQ